jgi:hypothetical protein
MGHFSNSRSKSTRIRLAVLAGLGLLLRGGVLRAAPAADPADMRLDGPPTVAPMLCDQLPETTQPANAAQPGDNSPMADAADAPKMSPGLTTAPYDPNNFRPDPDYRDKPYSAEDQYAIYGLKHSNPTQRPLLEIGEELFGYGPVASPNFNLLGPKDSGVQHLWVYGDWRNGFGYNDNGKPANKEELGVYASRLNLDIDYQFTSTERVHLFVRPLDKNNHITRYVFSGQDDGFQSDLNFNVDALFFEGDLGAITQGVTNKPSKFDLPITFGRIPLFFQNGIWMLDAIDGFAFTIPAKNSAALNISNMDLTFFAGFNHVDSIAVPTVDQGKVVDDNDHERVFGFNSFIETMGGYWEAGYGYTEDLTDRGFDYHNVTAAFTRRYGNFVSNSIRGIGNFGQDPNNHQTRTANGFLLLVENSFMTGQAQQTLVPYTNFFAGFDHPQPLARDPGAGGVLTNTGINFETDALTGFPTLDATAANTYGGAVGFEYLFNLDRQIVVEAATVQTMAGKAKRNAPGAEYAFGIRYQQPLTNAVILRVNAMYGIRNGADDIAGISGEIRWKF